MHRHPDPVSRRPAAPGGRRRRLVGALTPIALAVGALGASACESPPLGYVEANVLDDVLSVRGTNGPDTIVLRLDGDDPDVLEIDVHDDGQRDFAFARDEVTAITVEGFGGDDVLVTDDVNGRFTRGVETSLVGGDGDDTLIGTHGDERLDGGPGDDVVERRLGPIWKR